MSNPTIALYYDDYAREMDAALVEVRPEGLVLDRTVFYPRGGNQDGDQGTLYAPGSGDISLKVAEVLKAGDGAITHRTAHPAPAAWTPGLPLHGTLDWARRLTLMRLHTAQHMISRWFLDHGANGTTRVDISATGCLIELERPITLDQALDCQDELNAMIAAGRPVQRLDTGGYLEIVVEGYDRQACGGTHVHDAAEIGRLAFTRVKGNRLELQCGADAARVAREMAEAVLDLQGDLETDLAGFRARVSRLLAESRAQRAALFALREEVAAARIAGALQAPAAVATAAGPVQIYAVDLELIESKQLPRLLKPVQGAGRVFLCLCAGRNLAVVSGSPALPAGALVATFQARYHLRGGGSPAFAQCGPWPADVPLSAVRALAAASAPAADREPGAPGR